MYLAAICFSLAVDVDIDRYMVKIELTVHT